MAMMIAARRLGLQNLPLRQLRSKNTFSVCIDVTATRFLSTRRITKAGQSDLNILFSRIGFSQDPCPRFPEEGVHDELDAVIKTHDLKRSQAIRQFTKWLNETGQGTGGWETFQRRARQQQRLLHMMSAPSDRFYLALLLTSPKELWKSLSSHENWNRVMGEVWGRARLGKEIKSSILSLPTERQLPWPDHLARLGFLVLEESRQIMANELEPIFGDTRVSEIKTKSLNVTILEMNRRAHTMLLQVETHPDRIDKNILRASTIFVMQLTCDNGDTPSRENQVRRIFTRESRPSDDAEDSEDSEKKPDNQVWGRLARKSWQSEDAEDSEDSEKKPEKKRILKMVLPLRMSNFWKDPLFKYTGLYPI
jgi:hypothetical protein